MTHVLVTGGAGYIGAHTCLELLADGYEVVVVDNLCNGKMEALRRVEELAGRKLAGFHKIDVRDREAMRQVFRTYPLRAVIHFAALKAVGESVAKPLMYYENNVAGSIALTEIMSEFHVKTLVFSSSATVYGDTNMVPVREDALAHPINPYGHTKWMTELMLRDQAIADPEWRVALLRYFNPAGAHPSGRIGEDPHGTPNNLMPFVSQVALGKRSKLSIFGDDYDTPDGTGVRDYIHVMDLAKGHLSALKRLFRSPGVLTVNLGTGKGNSVLDVLRAFELTSGQEIPYEIVPRRAGDVAQSFADVRLAESELGWRAELGIEDMCRDAWNWQTNNPDGYDQKQTIPAG